MTLTKDRPDAGLKSLDHCAQPDLFVFGVTELTQYR